jgi:hypothetical protein
MYFIEVLEDDNALFHLLLFIQNPSMYPFSPAAMPEKKAGFVTTRVRQNRFPKP